VSCPDAGEMVEERIDRVLTQYRESPKLLHVLRTYLGAVAGFYQQVCDLPTKFDLDRAEGDQLTILGKRLGWPRCHCVCEIQPVFGFECPGVISSQPLAGLCDPNSTWSGCGEFGTGEICITDDDLYRRFLTARRRQFLGLFSTESLESALVELFGETARLLDAGNGRVVVAPGRDLTAAETAMLQLYPRVMPVALGVSVRFHFDDTYVFGFGEGWGGFCEDWFPDGTELTDELGEVITTEGWETIGTGPLTNGAPWMCEIDVRPYAC
jgi:hypothetical protein